MNLRSTLLFAAGIAVLFSLLSNSGGSPAGRTGAPGDQTCSSASCHSGDNLNNGGASVEIALADELTAYTPGMATKVTISLSNAQDAGKNGFEILALDAEGNNFGTWELIDENLTQTRSGSDMKEYVTHRAAGNSQTSWEINWVAPEAATDSVIFYVAVNDANNNGNRMGDNIYTTSLVVPSAEASSVEFLDAATVSIFPNPVADQITIRSDRYDFERFGIYDASGRQVRQGKFQAQLNVSNLETGLYTLQLIADEGQLIKKVQVSH